MNTTFFYFLFESSVYLLFFLAIYRLAIEGLTHFSWMRGYLLLSLSLSIILPLIKIPGQWSHLIMGNSLFDKPISFAILSPMTDLAPETIKSGVLTSSDLNIGGFFFILLSAIYLTGVLFKSLIFYRNIGKIRKSINNNQKHSEGKYWIVKTDNEVAAFSFLNYIFINEDYKNLTQDEFQKIKNHELVHAKQWHTIDILFIELISILFWFSPLVGYAKNRIKEIHEYIADERTSGHGEMKKNYAQLLFNLASEAKTFSLLTGFSGKQINKRILMVSKTRSLSAYKLIFIAILPVAAMLLLSFSYLNNIDTKYASDSRMQEKSTNLNSSQKIGKIIWINNTVVKTAFLNSILGLTVGDEYDKEKIERRIREDIVNLYQDKGYLFSNIEIIVIPTNKSIIDLTLKVFEGARYKVGTINIKGNKNVPTKEILNKICIKPGDLWSKSKLIQSVRDITMMGKFDPETIMPDVIPKAAKTNSEFGIVNIVFQVTEKQ